MAYRLLLALRPLCVRSLSKIAHIYRLIVTRVVGIQLVTQRASGKIKLHEVKGASFKDFCRSRLRLHRDTGCEIASNAFRVRSAGSDILSDEARAL
jgi:hypothetical protein